MLLAEREDRRRERQRLEGVRGQVWRVANLKRVYRAEVGQLEVREDVAIVDQYVFLIRLEHDHGALVKEEVRSAVQFTRDERVWSHVVRTERRFARRFIAPQERFARRVLGAQTEYLQKVKAGRALIRDENALLGFLVDVALFVPVVLLRLLVKVEALLLGGTVALQRALVDKTVEFPLLVKEGVQVTQEEVSTTLGRQRLRLALLDRAYLTPQRSKALLFVGSVMLLAAWLLAEVVIRAIAPEALAAKQQTDMVFLYSVATRAFLPTPYEVVLSAAVPTLGIPTTVLVAAAGAVVGSWFILLLGSQANRGVHRAIRSSAPTRRAVEWVERNADRYGYWLLGAWLIIPLSPDTVPIVIFGLLRLRVPWFLFTVFVATVVRSLLWLTVPGLFAGVPSL